MKDFPTLPSYLQHLDLDDPDMAIEPCHPRDNIRVPAHDLIKRTVEGRSQIHAFPEGL